MFKFHIENESIEMNKRDNGSLALSLGNYKFKENDKIDLIVTHETKLILMKKGELDRNLIFFNFTEKDTENIKEGCYKYSIVVNTDNFKSTIVNCRDFILQGGC